MEKVNEAGTLIIPLISLDTANVDANYGPWDSTDEYIAWLNSKVPAGFTIEPLEGTLIALNNNGNITLHVYQGENGWKNITASSDGVDTNGFSLLPKGVDGIDLTYNNTRLVNFWLVDDVDPGLMSVQDKQKLDNLSDVSGIPNDTIDIIIGADENAIVASDYDHLYTTAENSSVDLGNVNYN